MRRSAYSPQRFCPGVHVLCVLGVGDEHDGPLLKLEVSEAEQVVVERQNPVPAHTQVHSETANCLRMQVQGLAAAAAAAAAARQPDLRLSIQSPSSSSRVPCGCRLCRTGIRPPSVCKWPQR